MHEVYLNRRKQKLHKIIEESAVFGNLRPYLPGRAK